AQESSGKGSFDCRVSNKSGALVETSWAVQWSLDEASYFCVVRDVTEKKRLENMKREFMAMVSHDLRTPLASLQMIHTLLANGVYGELPDAAHKNVQQAEATTGRLIGMVSDLLEMERLDSGTLDLVCDSVEVAPIVSEACDSVRAFADQHKVALLNSVGEEIQIYADRDRIMQVLINLISNAIKFSPEHDAAVEIQAVNGASSMNVKVAVLDRGRGVPEALRAKIFERFRQVSREDKKKQAGAGLGLAICKMLVESHGGTIGVDDRQGGGSIFWFTLPRSEQK
ncbi:MAG: sensor histidine kinase, partial [Terriglobales bacterium]